MSELNEHAIYDYDSYSLIVRIVEEIDHKFSNCIRLHSGPCSSYWNEEELNNLTWLERQSLLLELEKIK